MLSVVLPTFVITCRRSVLRVHLGQPELIIKKIKYRIKSPERIHVYCLVALVTKRCVCFHQSEESEFSHKRRRHLLVDVPFRCSKLELATAHTRQGLNEPFCLPLTFPHVMK